MRAHTDIVESPVQIFSGQTARVYAGRLSVVGDSVRLMGEFGENTFAKADVEVRALVGDAPARLLLPNGVEVVCPNSDPIAESFKGSNTWITRLEKLWWVALAATVPVAFFVFWFSKAAVPSLSNFAAQRITPSLEADLGQRVFHAIDKTLVRPTKLAASDQTPIQRRFEELVAASKSPTPMRLHFRRATAWVGPNAFALPGGDIFITDQLVRSLNSVDLSGAVLAHEIGHVHHRHSLRKLVGDSMVAMLMGALVGDVSGVGGLMVGAPTLLLNQSYSRDFERESDQFAFDLLKKNGQSPRHFADAMRCLLTISPEKSGREGTQKNTASVTEYSKCDIESARTYSDSKLTAEGGESNSLGLLRSHPLTAERIAAAEAAAAEGEQSKKP